MISPARCMCLVLALISAWGMKAVSVLSEMCLCVCVRMCVCVRAFFVGVRATQ